MKLDVAGETPGATAQDPGDAAPPPWRRALSSGWVPASLVLLTAAVALLTHGLSAGEVLRFAAYCTFGLVLPGLVIWRLLVPRAGAPLLADAVFGTSLALAVEVAVHVAVTLGGQPGLGRWWPLVPLGLSLLPRWRHRVWRRAAPQPVWWSWSLSGLVLVALLVFVRSIWLAAPLTSSALRSPYVDIPYHLSLVTALSRQVGGDLPFVQGEPLYYHWFTHAHVAAERLATGIEPILLLSRLDMLLVAAVVLLGSAMAAQRLARSPLAGVVAAGVLALGGTALVWPHFTPLFLTPSSYISPTTAFACAILVGCVAVTVELLDPGARPPRSAWVAAAVLVVASSGAKGPALPLLVAGWTSVVVMHLVLRRRLHASALVLAVLGTVVFVAAQEILYGGSAQGTSVLPFGLGNYIAYDFGLLDQPAGGSLGLRVTLGTVYMFLRLSCLVAVIGLFTPRIWRHPHAHFVVGAVVGGVGATLLLDSATRNQVYFLLVTPVFVAVATGWGLVELLRRAESPSAPRLLAGSLLAGAVAGIAFWELRPSGFEGEDGTSLGTLLLQPLLVVALLAVAALAVSLSAAPRHAAPLVAAGMAVGLGLLTGPSQVARVGVGSPKWDSAPVAAPVAEIAEGGIEAARWLREHSSPDAVVATNSHCRYPPPRRCDHRAFWISGYAERQMLLEGWSYTSRSAELAAQNGVSVPFLPYWKPDLLQANDRAFSRPTPARLGDLRDEHGVDWLFVDKRYPVDMDRLEDHADLRLDRENYAVLRLR